MEKTAAAMNVVARWLVKATTTTGDGSARDWTSFLHVVSFLFSSVYSAFFLFFLLFPFEVAIEAVLILSPSAALAFADGAKEVRERCLNRQQQASENSLTDNIF